MKSKLKILIGLLVIALFFMYLIAQLRVVSDIGQFMPTARHDPQLQALMSELQNGPASTALMIRIHDAGSSTLADFSMRLRQKLIKENEIFREVRNGEEAMDWQEFERLFPYRYLLSEKSDWSSSGLHKTFQQRLVDLRSGAGAVLGDMLGTDPQLVFVKYLHGLIELTGPIKKHGVWFDRQQRSALMLLQVHGEKLELDLMQNAIDQVQKSFISMSPEATAQLEVAGPGVMAVETRAAIERVMHQMTLVIVLLLMIVFVFAYRSLRSLILASIPLASAILVALTVTQLFFGEVHSIVLVFGIALLGVCLDYPLHFFSHLRPDQTPVESLKKIWPTLRLGGGSSIFAFLALLGSGFDGLSQLSIFAASGLVTALAVTRYILPYWLSSDCIKPRLWSVHIEFSFKKRILIALILLMLPVVLIIQSDIFWETSIHSISPVPASARERDQDLRHSLNIPEVSHVFLLASEDVNSVLLASEKIEKSLNELKDLEIISSIWSPSQILPSSEVQYQRQLSLPSSKELKQNTEKALKGLPFRLAAFEAWVKLVETSRDLEPVGYDEILSTPLAVILRQGLFKYQNQWVGVVRVGGVRSNAELHNWLALHPDVKSSYVEIKRATEHLLNEYRKTTFERLIVVVIFLGIVVLLWSRSIHDTIWVLLPVGIGILSGIAMPLLMGTAINVFHLLALLLVLGMGLDYSLFFNRTNGGKLEQQQRFHAISISALTTSSAFLVLAFSSVPVLAGMGQTVSSGILGCFLSSWLLACPQEKSHKEEII